MPRSEKLLLSVARRHMATDFELEAVVDASTRRSGDSVLAECHRLIAELEDELSEFRGDSAVARLNRSGAGEWVEASGPALFDLLAVARRISERTIRAFDPLAKSEGPASFADLEIDARNGRIRRTRESVRLGFGAIGKGYALDRSREVLERHGFADYRLSCGGSSWVFGGFSATEDAWEIAWAWERDEDGDLVGHRYRLPAGQSLAIGVSGVLEQGNHFLRAGRAIEARVKSAFYCGRSAAEADACSTALLVGASEEGEGFLTRLEDAVLRPSFAYVDNDGTLVYNRDFDTQFLRKGRIT